MASCEEDDLAALSELLMDEEEEEEEEEEIKKEEVKDNNESDQLAAMRAEMLEMKKELESLKKQAAINEGKARGGAKKENGSICFKTGQRKRTAHEPLNNNETSKRRKVGVANDDSSCETERYTGLRVKNPLISSELMRKRMSGRKMIRIPQIHSNIKKEDCDISGDWVTGGVIVNKLPPKETVKGNKYSVWRLSNLSSQNDVVSLFLFDKAFDKHWKTSTGTIITVLNPKIQADKQYSDCPGIRYSISLDNPDQLMIVGISVDYTVCNATTKSGRKCLNFANKQFGGKCEYHMQGEYYKMKSKRMDCQGAKQVISSAPSLIKPTPSYGPKTTDIHAKILGKTEVFHQGKWFSSEKMKAKRDCSEDEYNERLFVPGARDRSNEVQLVLGRELCERSGGVKKFKDGVRTQSGSEIFKKLLKTQTPGAVCYNKHLNMKKETTDAASVKKETKTALDLLKEHSEKPALTRSDFELFTPDHVTKPVTKAMPPVTIERSPVTTEMTPVTKATPPVMPKPVPLSCKENVKLSGIENKDHAPLSRPKGHTPLLRTSISSKPPSRLEISKQRAKEHALSVLKKDKEDKNKLIKSRIEKDTVSPTPPSALDIDRLERILSASSSHDSAVNKDEREAEDSYFAHLEKKEAIEEKLRSTKELQVRAICCNECDYVAESASERCRKEGHSIKKLKAIKRCFKCDECGSRIYTYNERHPKRDCYCGKSEFKPVSLYKVRSDPKLPSQELSLRGDEIKFLNSLS